MRDLWPGDIGMGTRGALFFGDILAALKVVDLAAREAVVAVLVEHVALHRDRCPLDAEAADAPVLWQRVGEVRLSYQPDRGRIQDTNCRVVLRLGGDDRSADDPAR